MNLGWVLVGFSSKGSLRGLPMLINTHTWLCWIKFTFQERSLPIVCNSWYHLQVEATWSNIWWCLLDFSWFGISPARSSVSCSQELRKKRPESNHPRSTRKNLRCLGRKAKTSAVFFSHPSPHLLVLHLIMQKSHHDDIPSQQQELGWPGESSRPR